MALDLEMALRGRVVELDVVDIERDEALVRRYGDRIPVLCLGEAEVCFGRLDTAALERHLSPLT